MAELLFGEIKKFNTVEFLLLEGGTESFRGGRSGMIQDVWIRGGDLYHPETKFSLWTKSKRGLKNIVLDVCYVEGDRPPTKKEVNQAVKIFEKELSRKGWLFKKAKRERDLMGHVERDWRSAQW